MGERAIDNIGVIDDTFAGLLNPRDRIDLGRPDLKERPGDTLVEAVRTFEREGGFKALQKMRDERRREAEAPDVRSGRRDPMMDVSLPAARADLEGNDIKKD